MLGQMVLSIIVLLFILGNMSLLMSVLTDRNHIPVYYIPETTCIVQNSGNELFLTDEDSGILEIESDIVEDKKPISDILETFSMEELEVAEDILDIYDQDIILDDD